MGQLFASNVRREVQNFATRWKMVKKIRQQATFSSPNLTEFDFNRYSLISNSFWMHSTQKSGYFGFEKKSGPRKNVLVAPPFCFSFFQKPKHPLFYVRTHSKTKPIKDYRLRLLFRIRVLHQSRPRHLPSPPPLSPNFNMTPSRNSFLCSILPWFSCRNFHFSFRTWPCWSKGYLQLCIDGFCMRKRLIS